jgi:Ca2+-binding RTX toxin-like protein
MNGNLGNDTYYLDNTGDVVIENAGVGTGWDIVNSSITYTLLTNAEGLILIGTAAINGTGNTTDNRIIGNSVNNIIDGGTGADWMTGGAGNDTYHVDNTGDRIDEAANEGWDTVWTAINHTLSANVEMLRMDSGAANLNGYGNTINNYMVGNDGNNILDGQSGADTMTGGLGDDSYYVDNISDVITELTGQGTDTIYASISFDLANAPNVENLSLTGTEAINATGNGTGNRLTGNSADNIISDGGATVAATMIGGAGNDTYNVNNTADLITENENSGWDIVNSSVSYTLSSNVDALVLTGTASTNATGNANDNRIIGNSADNIINGGVGADWMAGETGNDTYNVDNVSDRVDESYYQGWDVIWTSVTYTLPINIEALWMNPSAGNIIGYGNVQYNFLVGNEGNNLLDGQAGCDTLVGGLGADTLIGGLGQDLYDLSEATASTDTIRVAAGDSPASIGNYDYAIGFKLGTGTINTVGVDQLDLVNTTIASNASNVNGIDSGPIMSHQINNGIISFDSSDTHTSPLAISEGYLGLIFDYLHNNITGGQTVGFVCSANTYVYQAGSTASTTDTLVELVGVSATSLSTTGLAANAVWIV